MMGDTDENKLPLLELKFVEHSTIDEETETFSMNLKNQIYLNIVPFLNSQNMI